MQVGAEGVEVVVGVVVDRVLMWTSLTMRLGLRELTSP